MSKRNAWGMVQLLRPSVNSNEFEPEAVVAKGAGSDVSSVLEKATFWLSQLEKGLSEKEAKGLRGWLASASLNRQIFFEMAEIYDDMNAISGWGRSAPTQAEQEPARQAPQRTP
jgi:hypothetical protein